MKPSGAEPEPLSVSVTPKIDKLVERVSHLTCPRDYLMEKAPSEGLVESLPTEGTKWAVVGHS